MPGICRRGSRRVSDSIFQLIGLGGPLPDPACRKLAVVEAGGFDSPVQAALRGDEACFRLAFAFDNRRSEPGSALPCAGDANPCCEGMKAATVAGFQGISPEGRVMSLGRGGSDTTAVASAAAFGAERCDIYTDVDGIYTADPGISRKARKLDRIAFEKMLELASFGAKVLQTRSVELAACWANSSRT